MVTQTNNPTPNFHVYINSMMTQWQKIELPSLHMFNDDTDKKFNFQVCICSMMTLTKNPNGAVQSFAESGSFTFSLPTSSFQIYIYSMMKFILKIQMEQSKVFLNLCVLHLAFQLPNLHTFNADTLTKNRTFNFQIYVHSMVILTKNATSNSA